MNVMILAAGEGTRLRPYTLEMPKPGIPFLGAPLASYSLALLDQLPVDNLVVNTYHLPQKIKDTFFNLKPRCKKLLFSDEHDVLLGSGGGIHKAKTFLQGTGSFLVLNGDEVILPHSMGILQEMVAFHHWHKGIATLLTMKHPEVGTKFGGAWLNEGTKVQCFSKTHPGGSGIRGLHFLGVMVLSERVFKYFKDAVEVENILYETLTKAMSAGEEVHAFEVTAEWFETGNPEDFNRAAEYCMDQINKTNPEIRPYWQEHLLQTVRIYSEEKTLVEKGSALEGKVLSAVQKWKQS